MRKHPGAYRGPGEFLSLELEMEGSVQITKFLLGFPLRPVGISQEEIFLVGMPCVITHLLEGERGLGETPCF